MDGAVYRLASSCGSQTPFQPPMSVSCVRWLIWKDGGGLRVSSLAEPTSGDLGVPMPLRHLWVI